MPGPSVGPPKNLSRILFYLLPASKKQNWIQVSLHRSRSDRLPALIQRNPPVQADHLSAGLFHRRQKRGTVGAEIDDRRSSLLQRFHQFGGARHHVTAIVIHAKAAHPTVEYLDHVGARAHLFRRVL